MTNYRFNIRVYGLLINSQNEILVTDEKRFGTQFTKFPGGGLEFGEGTNDCIMREMKEELNIEIEVIDHFYTTDFYQQSAFKETDQIISIYYLISTTAEETIQVKKEKFAFDIASEEIQIFRWMLIDEMKEEDVTFPIDKIVVQKLKGRQT